MTHELLKVTFEANNADERTIKHFSFEVQEGAKALEVRFYFEPPGSSDLAKNEAAFDQCIKEWTEGSGLDFEETRQRAKKFLGQNIRLLRNQVNCLVYGPDGTCLGRCDIRGETSKWWLSEAFSSPGFTKVRLEKGRYSVAVEIWQVITEKIKIGVEVLAHLEEPTKTESQTYLSQTRKPPKLELLKQDGLLVGEMHAHTTHSDGIFSPMDLCERAVEMGLDFLAITDHNTTSSFGELTKPPLPVMLGEEVTTFNGHFCLYGIKRCYEWHDNEGRIAIAEALFRAKQEGATVSLAHAKIFDRPLCAGCSFVEGTVPFDVFDLMEVWSGAFYVRAPGILKAIRLWDRLLDAGINVVGIAGRDWHGFGQENRQELEFPVTCVYEKGRTPEGILAAIKRGRVFVTVHPLVAFTATAENGNHASLGETLWVEPTEQVRFSIEVISERAGEKIVEMVHNGKSVWKDGFTTGSRTLFPPYMGPGRYRVQVWSSDGFLLALTNHIFVEITTAK